MMAPLSSVEVEGSGKPLIPAQPVMIVMIVMQKNVDNAEVRVTITSTRDAIELMNDPSLEG
jgi:hypothetical protein